MTRRPTTRLLALLSAGVVALAGCAEIAVGDEADAEAPMLSGQVQGGPSANQDDASWGEEPGSTQGSAVPTLVGSPDASAPGPESPPDPAMPDPGMPPQPAHEGDAGAAAPPEDPPPEAPPEVPDAALPEASACVAELCNGLDDDCDGVVDNGVACPCDVVHREGSAYLLCANGQSWPAARGLCRSLGYDLVVLDGPAEDAFVFNELRARNLDDAFIGLNDQASEGQFVWLDGEAVPYTHWDDGEPNDGGDGGEDCAVLMTREGRRGLWDDRGCDSQRPAICESLVLAD